MHRYIYKTLASGGTRGSQCFGFFASSKQDALVFAHTPRDAVPVDIVIFAKRAAVPFKENKKHAPIPKHIFGFTLVSRGVFLAQQDLRIAIGAAKGERARVADTMTITKETNKNKV